MMFSIAYLLLQRLCLLVARSGLLFILASIEILLVPISWCSIFNSLHISFLEFTFQLSPNFWGPQFFRCVFFRCISWFFCRNGRCNTKFRLQFLGNCYCPRSSAPTLDRLVLLIIGRKSDRWQTSNDNIFLLPTAPVSWFSMPVSKRNKAQRPFAPLTIRLRELAGFRSRIVSGRKKKTYAPSFLLICILGLIRWIYCSTDSF